MTVWMASEMLPVEIVLEQSCAHLKPCSGYAAESQGVSPGRAQAGVAVPPPDPGQSPRLVPLTALAGTA